MSSEQQGFLLRFGIPSLDLLMGTNPDTRSGEDRRGEKDWQQDCGMWIPHGLSTSVAIIGPDGTGKSVLALHLASTYLRDTDYKARVLYVSTDLVYHRAQQVWESFALNYPSLRDPVFTGLAGIRHRAQRKTPSGSESPIPLIWYYPGEAVSDNGGPQPFFELVHGQQETARVAFLDIAQHTAGDDWGFLNRVIATIAPPEDGEPKHLVVIDAIEGFQAFSGDTDAFGEKISRRSRISQIMRLTAGKSHIVFVTEEPREGEHSAEEFVTDAVIRLRNRRIRDYARRTVEIEKVRSQSHVRGEHPYTIRKGTGSSTGDQVNDDDPVARHPGQLVPVVAPSATSSSGGDSAKLSAETASASKGSDVRPQGYVTVFPSVHCLSREIMKSVLDPNFKWIDPRTLGRAGFGIPYLDELLVPADQRSDTEPLHGLPFGKVTALIGDPHSQKGKLGRCFLAEEFKPYLKTLYGELERVKGDIRKVNKVVLDESAKTVGAVVLLTTLDQTRLKLIGEFTDWFRKEIPEGLKCDATALEDHLKEFFRNRITCRRLEVHDIPNSVLLHVVAHVVEATNERLKKLNSTDQTRMRLVIEDFSTWKEIYPDIRSEALLLPALLAQLRRANVSTLLIDTHPGRPDATISDPFDSELRAMVDYQLYTWRVPYFGENRTAIAAIPPMSGSGLPASDSGAVVRELRWTPEDERPAVDTLFEMYSGLEEGRPEPVPLEIRLFGETGETKVPGRYFEQENHVLGRIYRAVPEGSPAERAEIIKGVPDWQYEAFHDVTVLQQETRLDYTLVLAVDEFWRRYRGSFRNQREYMRERYDGVDPSGRFAIVPQSGWGISQEKGSFKQRWEDFNVPAPEPLNLNKGEQHWPKVLDRIPFSWDFGFLLCRGDTWFNRRELKVTDTLTVRDIWDRMVKAPFAVSELCSPVPPAAAEERPTWREFLGACARIAEAEREINPDATAFDLDAGQGESLSCLVLEVWASEIRARLRRDHVAPDPFDSASTTMFRDLVKNYTLDLFKSILLLVDVLPLKKNSDPRFTFRDSERPVESGAIAARHWYKTACKWQAGQAEKKLDDPFLHEARAVGLPGLFSTRGDWYLAVPGNSRSFRLADQACDYLCSQRANYTRMHLGLGLPTRHVPEDPKHRASMHTALLCRTERSNQEDGYKLGHLTYGSLCDLGQRDEHDSFRWLWRSKLGDYDRHARQWRRWLRRVLVAWSELREQRRWPEGGCFTIYDHITRYFPREKPDATGEQAWKSDAPDTYSFFAETWTQFQELADLFIKLGPGVAVSPIEEMTDR